MSTDSSPGSLNVDRYMKERVDDQIDYYCMKAGRSKKWHVWTQGLILVLGAIAPVLYTISPSWAGEEWEPYTRVVVTVISLALAVLAGLSNVWNSGEAWINFRSTEEQLKAEKFKFLTRSGKYRDSKDPFSDFVVSCENIMASEQQRFRNMVEESLEAAAKSGGDRGPSA